MSKLLVGATLLALGSHAPAHQSSHPRPGCRKLYTVAMTQRAARATFAGTRRVRLREFKHLGRMEMCQRNPQAQDFVRAYDRRQRAEWHHRQEYDPVIPGGLVGCIVHHESENPYVTNSSGHMGYGQWDESTWLADGGGRYGHTPLDATPKEQLLIIEEQVARGNYRQWTDYDPC